MKKDSSNKPEGNSQNIIKPGADRRPRAGAAYSGSEEDIRLSANGHLPPWGYNVSVWKGRREGEIPRSYGRGACERDSLGGDGVETWG